MNWNAFNQIRKNIYLHIRLQVFGQMSIQYLEEPNTRQKGLILVTQKLF